MQPPNAGKNTVMPPQRRVPIRFAAVLAGLTASLPLPATAAELTSYPTKPIRMIVPFTAGSGSDTVARVLAPRLLDALQGKMTYASTGVGSGTHYGAELFRRAAGFDAIHVPYKGVPEAVNDTMTGRVDFYFPPILAALPLLRDGRLIALGTTAGQRLQTLPEVPTIAEAGLPEFSYVGWWGMLAPEKTPRAVVDKLSSVLRQMLAQPDIRNRLESLGGESYWTSPAEFSRIIRTEIVNRARIFGDAKASVQ